MFVDRLRFVKLLQLPFKLGQLLLHCCLWAEIMTVAAGKPLDTSTNMMPYFRYQTKTHL